MADGPEFRAAGRALLPENSLQTAPGEPCVWPRRITMVKGKAATEDGPCGQGDENLTGGRRGAPGGRAGAGSRGPSGSSRDR